MSDDKVKVTVPRVTSRKEKLDPVYRATKREVDKKEKDK